ncbi:ArfGap-domain-containing protein [Cubamyces sp. BRFM 1775]|nr:ArfGap-domain-containing protein [Cubamyces sp. BRFM 1775]
MSYKQDKATTERHARTLRELLKRPENKTCADCKRNDPRWASWNLGVFLCIRCSGIHRSMGTHISKVKSVDLDVWTPEQMASVQKWGNRRANLYWEAHLRAGHIPPDHKMESYIRSKYESRRWAREGPPPEDPAVLESDAPPAPAAAPAQPATPVQTTPSMTHTSRGSVSARPQQAQTHQLLSASVAASRQAAVAAPALAAPQQQQQPQVQAQAQPPQQQQQNAALDLFSLDFHAPASAAPQAQQEQPKKDVKSEIMSLFSTAAPASAPAGQSAFGGAGLFGAQPAAQNQLGGWGGVAAQPQAAWGAPAAGMFGQQQQAQQVQQAVPQQTSMMGNAGVGMWGANSGWNAPTAPAAPAQSNIWGSSMPAQQQSLFSTSDVWSTPAANTAAAPAAASTQKKDDVFGDLWGGFK